METLLKPEKKFKEWADKIQDILATKSESKLDSLPEKCRWLRYWGNKLREDNSCNYKEFERIETKLLGKVAYILNNHYSTYLKKAENHRKGTKVRLNEILRYVYRYGYYVHSCFITAGKKSKTKKILQSFWNIYEKELSSYLNKLDDSQIEWLSRLIKQSQSMGIEIGDEITSNLMELKPPDAFLVEKCKNQLKEAEKNLVKHETITALILADQTLELFLKDFCIRWECDYYVTNVRGKSFIKWGIPDYVRYLWDIGEIEEKYKVDFYLFHEWRNCAQHKGLEPSERIVRHVIDKIAYFINENIE